MQPYHRKFCRNGVALLPQLVANVVVAHPSCACHAFVPGARRTITRRPNNKGVLGVLRFLFNHPAGCAAFAYESQSGHVVRSCVGTLSAIVTDAAMCCLSTVVVYFQLYYSFGLMQPPSLEYHERNFSRSARSMVVSVQEVMETSLADHAPKEDDILSTFE